MRMQKYSVAVAKTVSAIEHKSAKAGRVYFLCKRFHDEYRNPISRISMLRSLFSYQVTRM